MTGHDHRSASIERRSQLSLEQRVADLSPEKLAVLHKRLLQKRRPSYNPIRALPDEEVYPLSFHQQRLWFIEQLRPGTPLYNVTRAIRMRGSLNHEALKSSLQLLVTRHEVLRSTFHLHDGEPVQRINAPPKLQLPIVDLSKIAGESQETELLLLERLTAEGRNPFELSEDAMLRTVLYHVSDDEHVLQITIHHLACDGWSLQLLFKELAVLYRAYCAGDEVELPRINTRYVDFARWQREPQQEELFAERLQWWNRRLAGAPTVLELAADRPRPRTESGGGSIHPFDIPSDLIQQLKILGEEEGATLYMTLLTGFFIALHRYTGMEDFLVGSAIAGRQHPETHGMVGFFVDTVALRADFSGDPTARQVLQRVRQIVIDALQHSDLPFDRIVQSFDLQREFGQHPLFQVVFNTPPQYSLEFKGLDVTPVNVDLRISRFDLETTYADGANRTTGVSWNTDLFDAETIERMVGHYGEVLRAIVADPDQPVQELSLLTRSERHQLLVEWNDTGREYPEDKCVHELFEDQVNRVPDSVAVVFNGEEMTYRQLNHRSNQLAHYLRDVGVGPETLVGLCLERSSDLVVGILGILKAGGAYVPMDADYPRQRLEFMSLDAGVELTVTQQKLLDHLPACNGQFVSLDSDAAVLESMPRSNPQINVTADKLAYVMYTSGSTGQPKGVQIQHDAVTRLVYGNDYATFGADRVFLQLATASFDASTFELWGALLHGAKLIVAPHGLPDFRQLEELIQRNKVTTLWLTTSLFNQVVEHYPQALDSVDEILTGGEALSVQHVRAAQAKLGPSQQLINGYGPTECTTFASCYRIPSPVSSELESVPIGHPIANTQVYVLDRQLQPVPIGVPGELYIGGNGLARGYLNRPTLTNERFISNPFFEDADARLYRTGDRCRWNSDGNLEFLERLDDQIKLRGFRIELGEVESTLSEYPDVARSVVVLREDRPGDKRLVAYCVRQTGHELDLSDLRRHLRSRIPDYMVPATFVDLKTLPLTSSGKVNRRALPAPDDSRPELEAGYVAPRNTIEQRLAAIWCDLLGMKRVGIDDNFFELGGHSLLAARLFLVIEQTFGRKLPLALVFQHGTIGEIAKRITDRDLPEQTASILPLHSGGDGRPLFMMPGMVGEVMGSVVRALVKESDGSFPVLGVQPALNAENVERFRDLRSTARYYADAVRSYQTHGPYALAGYSFGGMMAYEVARLLTEQGESVDLLAVIDTGPGWRGMKLTSRDHAARVGRIVANLPLWLREESRQFSAYQFADRVLRKLRRWYRLIASGGCAKPELGDVYATDHVSSLDRAIMQAAFAAFQDYVPEPFPGKVTLFRANARALLRGCSHDIGWGRYAKSVEVRRISGGHVSILRRPYVDELVKQLSELLNARN